MTQDAQSSRGTILVVDDDRLVLVTLVHGLAQAGYEVIDADNGDDAILLARQHRPELALLDIRMDGLSGFDVAAYLREHLRIPFMFLSAFSDEATLARIRSLGALAHLVKPLDLAQIVPAVDAAMARLRAGDWAAPADEAVKSAPGGTATGAAASGVVPPDPLAQPVAIAVGIVMHRYSLPRAQALERLQRLAQQEGRSLEACAQSLIVALEQLSLPGL